MLLTKSISGKTIRLPDERWRHIVEGHPEMAGHINDVLLTVATPDYVFEGSTDEMLAAMYQLQEKFLVVVYKEEVSNGFIVTAFFTSKIDKLLKRKILWQK